MRVRISADSTCDLSRELIGKYNIGITPLYIIMDGASHLDGVDCSREDIYAFVKRTGRLCSTAAVTVADYCDAFAASLAEYDQVVHLTISSDMSACYQNACIAAEDFPGRVFVVDSRNLSTGIGHLALDAAELAAAGHTGAELKAELDERRSRLNVSFVLDTLDFLYKGGRCSGVAALGANLLHLKPCIEVRDGGMAVGKKYRGALEKCFAAYLRDRLAGRDDVDTRRIFLTHSGLDAATVERLTALLGELCSFEQVYVTMANGTISNHCGPNCMGILYYNK